MSNIKCGLCRQTFDASEELCGDCREEVDDSWRANLAANLAAAGMAAARERDADLATIAQLQHEAADYATRMDKWRARYGEAAAERDALRAEVERMRAVVEAAEAFASHFDADDASQYGARRSFTAFYAALDAAKETGKELGENA